MRAQTFRTPASGAHVQANSTGTGNPTAAQSPPASVSGCFLTIETTGAYVTFDGSVPAAGNGLFLPTGVVHFLPIASPIRHDSSGAGASKLNILWVI